MNVAVQPQGGVHGQEGVVAEHGHAQLGGDVGHLHADGPQADDAQHLARQLRAHKLALALLHRLLHVRPGGGLLLHPGHAVADLSGGQQQRTAIGRAIVKNPDILLCDEPTGALDYNTSKEILKLIETVNHKYGNTIVMVTHNDAIKDMADRVVKLRDGMIRRNYQNEQKIPAADLEW